MQIKYFCHETEWKNIKQLTECLPTPFILIDKSKILRNFKELASCFNYGKIYYAMKANPDKEILSLLDKLGSYFDFASIYELRELLTLGISPKRLSFGNTIKKVSAIKYAFEQGVRDFVTDSENDLINLSKYAPGSNIFVRILVEGSQTAEWPLSRKFGCQPDMSLELLEKAIELGLNPVGVSFHVGSQQHDIGSWDSAIAKVKYIFDWIKKKNGIELKRINIGGGFPTDYNRRTNSLDLYASEIKRYLDEDFGKNLPEIWLEPGRALVGNAGVLVSEIVLVSRKSKTSLNRWIYLDAGMFNGLIETIGECIKYPVYTAKDDFPEKEEAVLAGPTCDSMDVMYEDQMYSLPLNLVEGDKVYWFSTGAYTQSYASVNFNGFPSIKAYVMKDFSVESFNKLNIERGA
ncbi:MAG: ornithine decarboxylase [Candidatus Cloacimonadota bacterium]|nr:MAG: ornithine decarboxylase [Candidatus Cloacimonadota bacterium]PIE79284.1 MAG: ornithine decarboxylase [Candidatus Delongbacteria bacterium]